MASSIKSGRALAKALGVGESTVREYLQRAEWPVKRRAPWSATDLQRINAWRRQLQEDRGGSASSDDDTVKINKHLKLESMLLKRTQRKKLEGTLVEKHLLDGALEGLAKLFVQTLADLERSLPPELAGKDPGQIESCLHARFRAARESLAARQLLELETIEQVVKAANLPKARGRPAARR